MNYLSLILLVIVYTIDKTDASIESQIGMCKTLCDFQLHPTFSGPECFMQCCEERNLPCTHGRGLHNGTYPASFIQILKDNQAHSSNEELENEPDKKTDENNHSRSHGSQARTLNQESKMKNNKKDSENVSPKMIGGEHDFFIPSKDHHHDDHDHKNDKKKDKFSFFH